MDLIKVGKLIAKLRKEKNMTQEELADKFGITGKSVSKWERGINAPDIGTLEPLSLELGISINELLSGEIDINKNNQNDNTIIDILNYYNTKFKHKNLLMITIIVIIVSLLFSLIFTINNFNKCSVYSIASGDQLATIDGYMIFNQSEKIIVINNIFFTDEYAGTANELKAKNVHLSLISGKKVIFNNLYENSDLEFKSLSNLISTMSINISDKNIDNQNILSEKDLKNMYLVIKYDDVYNKNNEIKIKVNFNHEFANNKLFY